MGAYARLQRSGSGDRPQGLKSPTRTKTRQTKKEQWQTSHRQGRQRGKDMLIEYLVAVGFRMFGSGDHNTRGTPSQSMGCMA